MLIKDFIEAKTNIEILIRERGKLVGRRETHNIFPYVGQAWLAQLICGDSHNFITYMGLGIGGSKQTNPIVDQPPLDVYTPVGGHNQTDTDMTVTALERAVAVSSTTSPIDYPNDTWLKAVSAVTHPSSSRTRFTCVFAESDVSFGVFTIVPVSEIGLFTMEKSPLIRVNQFVAYDTFAPLAKTTALELEVRWTVIF